MSGKVRSAFDAPVMRNRTLHSLLALALLALMTALPFPVIALDTSTGVGSKIEPCSKSAWITP